ncbi:hypothetical protein AVEN_66179-1 [Araneus ventricosus]|uniref:Uncharacterized protein n=1 Tax=Araneus ventricosus TaxID=182803 RepID=A0A4Y2AZQ0_ARAVE|nr:hypothetical protein AVEN_66179-1 [Araneus ventricosus]
MSSRQFLVLLDFLTYSCPSPYSSAYGKQLCHFPTFDQVDFASLIDRARRFFVPLVAVEPESTLGILIMSIKPEDFNNINNRKQKLNKLKSFIKAKNIFEAEKSTDYEGCSSPAIPSVAHHCTCGFQPFLLDGYDQFLLILPIC